MPVAATGVASPQGGCLGATGPRMESYNSTAKPISPCLGAHEAHPKTTLFGVVFQKLNGPLLTSAPQSPLEVFAPTPEFPEIAEAQVLLAALVETDEVKTAATARQRRLKLQTDYGQAMMWSKGYVADETKAAFAHLSAWPKRASSNSSTERRFRSRGPEAPQSRRKIGRERANLAGGTLLAKDRRIFACPGWHPSRVCAILPPGSSATASLSVEELCSASIPRSELRRCACG
jgi:hypothetical protein